MATPGSAELTSVDGQWVLFLAGDIDYAAVGHVSAAGLAALGSPHNVVADLAEVSFIDSMGLGALVSLRNALHSGGRTFSIRNTPPNVARLLSLTGLDELLNPAGDPPVDPVPPS